jgi:glycosyltransferase involved in cell wall biosynthesis
VKIAVNIHCLHPPLSGIGHYARNLILQLLEHESVEDLVGVSHSGWHSTSSLREMVQTGDGVAPPGAPVDGPVSGLGWRALRRVTGGIPGLGRLRASVNHRLNVRERRYFRNYLYWEPNYLLLPVANRALATVHDLSHLRFPQFHPEERLAELRHLPDSLRRAQGIATVSEFSRRELADFFSLDPASISLVPPAVSPLFRPRQATECEALRASYQLPEHYILYAGTIEPRKNLPRLLQAYCELPEALQREFKLVLAGGVGWHGHQFDEAFEGLDARNIVRLGYVPRQHVPALFSAASLLAYPSIYEGFGMPVLEAMASGTPVLTANAASLPEVSAGAAQLVDPYSPEDIGSGLQRVLEDAALRESMVTRGLAVAAGYSWESSANALVQALRGVERA